MEFGRHASGTSSTDGCRISSGLLNFRRTQMKTKRAEGKQSVAQEIVPISEKERHVSFFDKCSRYDIPAKIKAKGVWPYFRVLQSAQDPEVMIDGRKLV